MSTTLNSTFRKVGNDFGYEIYAEYAAFRILGVCWQRTYWWAEFQVSDFSRMQQGMLSRASQGRFSPRSGRRRELHRWCSCMAYRTVVRRKAGSNFIWRDCRISFDEGEHKNLEEVVDTMREKVFIEDLGKTRIFRSNEDTSG